ncbi:MAG: hypothetical protein GJT30_08575 [Geobacter sp.]|nr:hypothetical protein [Geobacter sp.]
MEGIHYILVMPFFFLVGYGKTIVGDGVMTAWCKRALWTGLMGMACWFWLVAADRPVHAAEIEGVVLNEAGPVPGGQVKAYARLADIASGTPLAVSTTGDKPGFYRLELPAGKYYLVAEGTVADTAYFAFHGANPVVAGDEKLWLPFAVVPHRAPVSRAAPATALSGTVTYHGQPVSVAQVSLYGAAGGRFKGLGLLSNVTAADGAFRFSVAPGSYLVVARKRAAADGSMQLRKGDLFCFYPGNPLHVADNEELSIELPCYPKDDVDGFLGAGASVKKSREGLARFRDKGATAAREGSVLAGRVVDIAGRPVKISVQAYRLAQGKPFLMHYLRLMPDRQAETAADGSFRLSLPSDGDYAVVAREYAGQAPLKGEWYGLYEGNVDHAVSVAHLPGTAEIVVSRLMSATVDSRKNTAQAAVKAHHGPLRLADAVISADTTWSGEVEISGTVLVGRRATLTILPGTRVRFLKVDRNNDGIGDGELRVLGRLVAQGTARQPVRFMSGETSPQAGDWSYLLVYAAEGVSILDHCRVEDAFTGLQVHFSQAKVTNSSFRGNQEGIRFGRAELTIEHNDFDANRYGIRHTRLEGPVLIQYNTIRRNEVGIFLVPSNQNVVNFEDTFNLKEAPAPYQPVVRFNSLVGNREYAYKFGERQGYDIDLRDNWWGSVSERSIRAGIYDGSDDPTLGKAGIAPFLRSPAQGVGPRKEGAL